MFLSLPVSILYGTSNDTFPTCICNFAVMLDHFLFMYTELICTISVSPSCDSGSMSISTSWTAWFFCSYTPSWSALSCCMLYTFCHMLGIVLVCGFVCIICMSISGVLQSVPLFPGCSLFQSSFSLYQMPWFLSDHSTPPPAPSVPQVFLAHASTSSLVICILLFLEVSSLIILT